VTPAFEFAVPVIEQMRAAFGAWRAGCSLEPLPEAEVAAVADALRDAAGEVELPLRQVRMLAEAALAPVPGAFEDSGLGAKPKKRAVKVAAAKLEEVVEEAAPVEAAPAPVPAPKVKAKKAKVKVKAPRAAGQSPIQ
jgi:hypothetical protein